MRESIWPVNLKLYLLSVTFQEMFVDLHLRVVDAQAKNGWIGEDWTQ